MPVRGGRGTPLTPKQKAQRSVAAKASAAKRKAHASNSIRRVAQQSAVKGHTATNFAAANKHYGRADALNAAANKGSVPRGKKTSPYAVVTAGHQAPMATPKPKSKLAQGGSHGPKATGPKAFTTVKKKRPYKPDGSLPVTGKGPASDRKRPSKEMPISRGINSGKLPSRVGVKRKKGY